MAHPRATSSDFVFSASNSSSIDGLPAPMPHSSESTDAYLNDVLQRLNRLLDATEDGFPARQRSHVVKTKAIVLYAYRHVRDRFAEEMARVAKERENSERVMEERKVEHRKTKAVLERTRAHVDSLTAQLNTLKKEKLDWTDEREKKTKMALERTRTDVASLTSELNTLRKEKLEWMNEQEKRAQVEQRGIALIQSIANGIPQPSSSSRGTIVQQRPRPMTSTSQPYEPYESFQCFSVTQPPKPTPFYVNPSQPSSSEPAYQHTRALPLTYLEAQTVTELQLPPDPSTTSRFTVASTPTIGSFPSAESTSSPPPTPSSIAHVQSTPAPRQSILSMAQPPVSEPRSIRAPTTQSATTSLSMRTAVDLPNADSSSNGAISPIWDVSHPSQTAPARFHTQVSPSPSPASSRLSAARPAIPSAECCSPSIESTMVSRPDSTVPYVFKFASDRSTPPSTPLPGRNGQSTTLARARHPSPTGPTLLSAQPIRSIAPLAAHSPSPTYPSALPVRRKPTVVAGSRDSAERYGGQRDDRCESSSSTSPTSPAGSPLTEEINNISKPSFTPVDPPRSPTLPDPSTTPVSNPRVSTDSVPSSSTKRKRVDDKDGSAAARTLLDTISSSAIVEIRRVKRRRSAKVDANTAPPVDAKAPPPIASDSDGEGNLVVPRERMNLLYKVEEGGQISCRVCYHTPGHALIRFGPGVTWKQAVDHSVKHHPTYCRDLQMMDREKVIGYKDKLGIAGFEGGGGKSVGDVLTT